MEAARIAAVGVVAAVLAITVRKTNPEIAVQISIATGILIFLMVMSYITEAVKFVSDFAARMGSAYTGITIVLKVVGIAYICEFAVQALKDAGENAIASKVEFGGKIIIVVLTLPMITEFADTVMSLAEGL